MKDELKKLGFQVRPRVVKPRPAAKPGHIAFDDRGNAVYEWDNDGLNEEGEDGERRRQRALHHPGLSLTEDEPPVNAPIRNNTKGLRLGYNPYDSGLLPKKQRGRKRDLRELSKWIETRRKLQKQRSGED